MLANSDYCPQCLAGGGPSAVSGGLKWPAGSHGLCGDASADATPRKHEAGGKYWTGKITGSYIEGQVIKLSVLLTAYHKGRFGFRICKISGGAINDETNQLTESCFNQNVLVQGNVASAQAPGDPYLHIGDSTIGSGTYEAYYQLPPGLTCDGVNTRCVLQWYYLTGNSCVPPNEPAKYVGTSGMAECGGNAPYPEEFWNCADIKIAPAGSSPTPTLTPQTSPSVSSPSPVPSPTPSPSSTPVPNPSPTLTPTPTSSPSTSPAPSSTPAAFCASKGSYGFFADRATKCHSYFRCEATGSWYFTCPSQLAFNDAAQTCDWSSNVAC